MIRLSSHILIFSYSLIRKRPVRSTLLPILLPFLLQKHEPLYLWFETRICGRRNNMMVFIFWLLVESALARQSWCKYRSALTYPQTSSGSYSSGTPDAAWHSAGGSGTTSRCGPGRWRYIGWRKADKDDEENLLPDGGMLTAQPMKNRLTEWDTDSEAGTELYEPMARMGAENHRPGTFGNEITGRAWSRQAGGSTYLWHPHQGIRTEGMPMVIEKADVIRTDRCKERRIDDDRQWLYRLKPVGMMLQNLMMNRCTPMCGRSKKSRIPPVFEPFKTQWEHGINSIN